MFENPNNLLIKKPKIDVNTIWPIPVIKETFPTSFITFGLRLNPTINNNNATPI